MAQIKQHRWMLADPAAARQILTHSLTEYNSNLGDYSEPVLSIMNTLGIDRQKTIEVPGHLFKVPFSPEPSSYLEAVVKKKKITDRGGIK